MFFLYLLFILAVFLYLMMESRADVKFLIPTMLFLLLVGIVGGNQELLLWVANFLNVSYAPTILFLSLIAFLYVFFVVVLVEISRIKSKLDKINIRLAVLSLSSSESEKISVRSDKVS